MKQRRGIAIIGAALCVTVFTFGTVSAHAEDEATTKSPDSSVYSDDNNSSSTQGEANHTARDAAKQEIEKLRAEAKNAKERMQTVKDRLDGRRLRTCENHQATIKAILTRAANRGENRITLFTNITAKVGAFYTSKGKVLATYDQLVADVATKKAAAQAAVAVVKAAANSDFTCSSDNPKAQVAVFRADVKAEIAALKEYRTAVKNLIVGVKSVQATTEGGV
jgi:hypothetical protein